MSSRSALRQNLRPRLHTKRRLLLIGGSSALLLLAGLWWVLRPVPPAPQPAAAAPYVWRQAQDVSPAARAADKGCSDQLAAIEAEILTWVAQKNPDAAAVRRLQYLRRQASLLRQVQDLELRLALRGEQPGFDRTAYEARLRATRALLAPASH